VLSEPYHPPSILPKWEVMLSQGSEIVERKNIEIRKNKKFGYFLVKAIGLGMCHNFFGDWGWRPRFDFAKINDKLNTTRDFLKLSSASLAEVYPGYLLHFGLC